MKHRHKWRLGSYGGDTMTFRCVKKDCKATFNRKDRKTVRRMVRKSMDQSKLVHVVFHDFVRKMKLANVRHSDYAIMTKARRWSAKHPKDVIVTGCDDDHHSSSDLVVIAHRDKKRYWMGLTVIGLMQNGAEPFEFFLYPNHVKRLMEALKHFERLRRSCKNGTGF